MREIVSLRALGLSEVDAIRYYAALRMAEKGLLSAPNIAIGAPFQMGAAFASVPLQEAAPVEEHQATSGPTGGATASPIFS